MTTRISMLCIANTRLIVLQSSSLVHSTKPSGHFGLAIRRPFLRAKSPIFFKHGSNFGVVSLKCWTFKLLKNRFRFICTLTVYDKQNVHRPHKGGGGGRYLSLIGKIYDEEIALKLTLNSTFIANQLCSSVRKHPCDVHNLAYQKIC